MSKKLVIVARLPPLHPGEVLREEFLKPMGLTPYAVAKACGVPRTRIERFANEQTAVTADTARRLGKAARSAHSWFHPRLKAASVSWAQVGGRAAPVSETNCNDL